MFPKFFGQMIVIFYHLRVQTMIFQDLLKFPSRSKIDTFLTSSFSDSDFVS